ncbi:MAG: 2-phospho-L-lactate transferase [Alphaproteobacteria bacterium]|nr:2-phospho-L-lactate transferase [Alphaproteobacteria bacterium]MBV9586088.1 2-phospho-L-lactate transferase [Alphaproteobacteria bacterium]
MSGDDRPVLGFSGGIGGAKLALGLYRVLPPDTLTIVANTGDDFEHLGLAISPDLDTLLYTLSGNDNPELGWGRRGETWTFMAALEALGGATWFRLGDGDLATHIERTRRLRAGETLSQIMDDFRRRLGIAARLLPASDDLVRTRLHTATLPSPASGRGQGGGWLDFQDYFVRLRCDPVIDRIEFAGAADARAHPDAIAALAAPRLRAVVICPSNPFISIDPILAVPGVRAALRDCAAPVVAVSPIIGGKAVKGPTAKMMQELGLPVDAAAVAHRYRDVLDLYIADEEDAAAVAGLDIPVVLTRTLMQSVADREALARTVLAAADRVGKRAG